MNFLEPAYLWAFAGLAVPVAIHLLSRKEGRIIRIGSIRHIRETPTRQFRSIRLNEYLLLFLRCLLLAGFALFMSGWYLEDVKGTQKWLLLEAGLESRLALKTLIDSLSATGYEKRFLAEKYPKDVVPTTDKLDYYARLEELSRMRVDAVVLSTNNNSGFSGPRLALPPNVKWIEIAPERHNEIVRRVRINRDTVWERNGSFTSVATQFTTSKVPASSNDADARDTVKIIIAFDKGFEIEKEIVVASLNAIRGRVPEMVNMETAQATNYLGVSADWLIWLSESQPPAQGVPVVQYVDKPFARILEPTGQGNYLLTARLNSEVAVTHNLAVHLMNALFPDRKALDNSKRYDQRVVSARAAFGEGVSPVPAMVGEAADESSLRYLAIALLVILALERWVAYQRNQ